MPALITRTQVQVISVTITEACTGCITHAPGDIEKYVNRWGTTRSIYKPASASYAPILLGQTALFSLLATNSDGVEADLALGIDPFFFLWNPYNRKLEVNKLRHGADDLPRDHHL